METITEVHKYEVRYTDDCLYATEIHTKVIWATNIENARKLFTKLLKGGDGNKTYAKIKSIKKIKQENE